MTVADDPRIDSLRWITTPRSALAHLWLGNGTPCDAQGPGRPTLSARRCARCTAYAQGWLDRNDYVKGRWPNPLGDGPLPCSRDQQAANRRRLLRALQQAPPGGVGSAALRHQPHY